MAFVSHIMTYFQSLEHQAVNIKMKLTNVKSNKFLIFLLLCNFYLADLLINILFLTIKMQFQGAKFLFIHGDSVYYSQFFQ